MSKVFIIVGEMEEIPPFYGLVYKEYASMKSIFCPIPLNLIVRWCREIYFFLMRGLCKTKTETMFEKVRKNGFDNGYQAGIHNRVKGRNDKMELLQELIPVFREFFFCKDLTPEKESKFIDNAVQIVTVWLKKWEV